MGSNPIENANGDVAGKPGAGAETKRAHLAADAGTDESIARRLERNPGSRDARLDSALDESMDASDPPATAQPNRADQDLPDSSGFDAKKEQRLAAGKPEHPGLVERVLNKIGLS